MIIYHIIVVTKCHAVNYIAIMEPILKNIFEIRTKLGFSQEYMAKKLGLKQSGYNMIENGQRELKYYTLSQIAIYFDMDIIDVIKYPEKISSRKNIESSPNEMKAILQIELSHEKKEQVLKLVFGENNF